MPESADRTVVVSAAGPIHEVAARELAATLHLPCVAPQGLPASGFALCVESGGLTLRSLGPGACGPVRVDWCGGAMGYRRRHGRDRRGALVRAVCGTSPPGAVRVVDATAGLGRDGFMLAWTGCELTLVERNGVLAALLRDGLARARRDAGVGPALGTRLQVVEADAQEYLAGIPEAGRPHAVYLDPMYPHRRGGALVRKEMRVVRALAGDDTDAVALLETAIAVATVRVVVKRPAWAAPLSGPRPGHALREGDTRYDVYRC